MSKEVSFNFKAVYHQLGELTPETKEIWFVLHGYGQLPQYFIRKFKAIASNEVVIIAPGGLSKFYLEGFSGRVGATWMTKENRLVDIDNYVTYLEAVYAAVTEELHHATTKINFLGFSQGAATVTRWLQRHEGEFNNLIIWAGAFPIDMDIAKVSDKLKEKPVWMVRGTLDPFINEEVKAQQLRFIKELEISVNHISFEGKHDIDTETLLKLADKM